MRKIHKKSLNNLFCKELLLDQMVQLIVKLEFALK